MNRRLALGSLRNSVFSRVRHEDQQGSAMVMVLASIFLIGALITSMVSMTLFSAGRAGATRANAEATAAAEGGLEVAARSLFSPTGQASCESFLNAPGGTGLTYQVESIEYVSKGGSNFLPCTSGTIPQDADSVRISATGFANVANQRNTSRNTALMERTFERPPSFALDAAVFSGSHINPGSGMHNMALDGATEAGDMVSHAKFTCRTAGPSRYEGNVYALDGMEMSNNCIFSKDVVIKSSTTVSLSNYIEIGGNLQIEAPQIHIGNNLVAKGEVLIKGNVTVGGTGVDFQKGAEIQGNLAATTGFISGGPVLVTGDVEFGGNANTKQLSGDLRVGGDLKIGNPQTFSGSVYVGGVMTHSGSASTVGGSVYLRNQPSSGTGNQLSNVGEKVHAASSVPGVPAAKMEIDAGIADKFVGPAWEPTELRDPVAENPEAFKFPALTYDHEVFDSWDPLSRTEFAEFFHTGESWNPAVKSYKFNKDTCVLNSDQTFEITLERPTKIDLRGCTWTWSWSPKVIINTDSDVAIFADGFNINAGGGSHFTVRGKTDRVAGQRNPKLYLVIPADSESHQCTEATTPRMYLNRQNVPLRQTGSLVTPGSTQITVDAVLYSAGLLEVGNQNSGPLYGQIYGCNIKTSGSDLELRYSIPSSADTNLLALHTVLLRDVTF